MIKNLQEGCTLLGHRPRACLTEADPVAVTYAFQQNELAIFPLREIVAWNSTPTQPVIDRKAIRFVIRPQGCGVAGRDS
jgi:hypothetical protein